MTLSLEQAYRRAMVLYNDLQKQAERDPEQEIDGMAVGVLDSLFAACRALVPDDPVVGHLAGVVTADFIGSGEPVRAVSAALAVRQIAEALSDHMPVAQPDYVVSRGPDWNSIEF
jgi:hypothetical protein